MDSFSQYDREKVAQSGGISLRVHRFLEKGIVQQLDTPDTGTNVEKFFLTFLLPTGKDCQQPSVVFDFL